MTVARFFIRLFWTVVVFWCWVRRRHQHNEWPDVIISGARARPFRQCASCGAIALVEQGRQFLRTAKTDPSLSRETWIRRMKTRPFLGSLPGRNGLRPARR